MVEMRKRFALPLRVKLILLVAIPVILYVLSTVAGVSHYSNEINYFADDLFQTTGKVNTLVLNADRDVYQSLTAYQVIESPGLDTETAEKMKQDMSDNAKQALDRVNEAMKMLEAQNLLQLKKKDGSETIDDIKTSFLSAFPMWLDAANKAAADGRSVVYDPKLMEQFEDARGDLNLIGEIMDEYAGDQIVKMKEEAHLYKEINWLGLAVCLIVTLLLGAYMIRGITRGVRYVREISQAVSEGDLRERASVGYGSDEIGEIAASIDKMAAGVRRLIGCIEDNSLRVKASSEQLHSASRQSAEAAASISSDVIGANEGMEIQARGAEETARAIDEMAVGIGRVAENTSQISDYTLSTSRNAEAGQLQLDRLVDQMAEIKAVIGRLSGVVSKLSDRSGEIGLIAENITSFSTQTNILSLNASIEAARAGSHGRGFAVVAGEIRKLAAQSLESADVINQLVEATRDEVGQASEVMADTLREVERGSLLLNEVGSSFGLIRDSIQNIAAQIHDISAVSEQMSASSEEVSATMDQSAAAARTNMDSMRSVAVSVQEQLILMEDIAKAADNLRTIVGELEGSVATFTIR
jgi:methyl-accepting chemotaxis protein